MPISSWLCVWDGRVRQSHSAHANYSFPISESAHIIYFWSGITMPVVQSELNLLTLSAIRSMLKKFFKQGLSAALTQMRKLSGYYVTSFFAFNIYIRYRSACFIIWVSCLLLSQISLVYVRVILCGRHSAIRTPSTRTFITRHKLQEDALSV